MDNFNNSIAYKMMRITKSINHKLDVEYEKYHLTVPLTILLFIISDNAGITQINLCKLKDMDRTTCGKSIDKLETLGLVKREPCKEDRRAYNLFITKTGKDIAKKVFTIRQKVENDFFIALDENERDIFTKALDKLSAL